MGRTRSTSHRTTTISRTRMERPLYELQIMYDNHYKTAPSTGHNVWSIKVREVFAVRRAPRFAPGITLDGGRRRRNHGASRHRRSSASSGRVNRNSEGVACFGQKMRRCCLEPLVCGGPKGRLGYSQRKKIDWPALARLYLRGNRAVWVFTPPF